MEEYAAPLPDLHGSMESGTQRSLRRWFIASLCGFGAWVLLWALLLWGIFTDFLGDERLWLSVSLVGLLLIASLAAFPSLLAGLLHFRFRQGKVIFWISGLHAVLVTVMIALIAYSIAQDK